jgi:hypothetical protein
MVLRLTRTAVLVLAASAALLGTAVPASAAGERPSAYLNPDTGKPTENPGVRTNSECESPDRSDTAPLTDEMSGEGNVHVDACLFKGSTRVDTAAAFDVSGVGSIFKCPDPDMTGAKTAMKTGDTCLQSGWEDANKEFHIRLVSATAGLQTVRFCADPEANGCGDATQVSTVRIRWGAPSGSVAAGGSSELPWLPVGLAVIAVLAAGGATARVLIPARAR